MIPTALTAHAFTYTDFAPCNDAAISPCNNPGIAPCNSPTIAPRNSVIIPCTSPITPSLAPLDWGLLYGLGRRSSQNGPRPFKLLQIRGNPLPFQCAPDCITAVLSLNPSQFLELTPHLTLVFFLVTRVYLACARHPPSCPSSPSLQTVSPVASASPPLMRKTRCRSPSRIPPHSA